MFPDYGVASDARNRAVSCLCCVCYFSCEKSQCYFQYFNFTFLVKSPYVIFSISTSRSPIMLRFKISMFLTMLNDVAGLSKKKNHIKNVCIMTSGCIRTSFEKRVHLHHIGFMVYHENVKIRKRQISFILFIY